MKRLGSDNNSLKNKRILLRVDFNVPLDEDGRIADDKRIRSALTTIKYLLQEGSSVIIMSHLGRPKGSFVSKLSLRVVKDRLEELLNRSVIMASDCIGSQVVLQAKELKSGEVLLLENLRFHKEETENDPNFSKQLASLADVYVDDAFGAIHRAHSSTEGVTKYLKEAFAGFLIQKEYDYFTKLLNNPPRPFLAILGGAKVSDKILLIENLIEKVDSLIVAGGMAYTFFLAQGYPIGDSLVEKDQLELALSLMEKAKKIDFFLPVDHVIGDSFSKDARVEVTQKVGVKDGWEGLDIGPQSVSLFTKAIHRSKTILWNGPVGVFEWEPFSHGTRALAKSVADSSAMTVIGGGDTASAMAQFGLENDMDHISTGGGASLEFMEGKQLPGIVALEKKESF